MLLVIVVRFFLNRFYRLWLLLLRLLIWRLGLFLFLLGFIVVIVVPIIFILLGCHGHVFLVFLGRLVIRRWVILLLRIAPAIILCAATCTVIVVVLLTIFVIRVILVDTVSIIIVVIFLNNESRSRIRSIVIATGIVVVLFLSVLISIIGLLPIVLSSVVVGASVRLLAV